MEKLLKKLYQLNDIVIEMKTEIKNLRKENEFLKELLKNKENGK
tara:strand:- start:11174 stop:11305 length:132 start_codon:yes stop_codon:yes gene_type:complete